MIYIEYNSFLKTPIKLIDIAYTNKFKIKIVVKELYIKVTAIKTLDKIIKIRALR